MRDARWRLGPHGGTCRRCGTDVLWLKDASDRRVPVDPDPSAGGFIDPDYSRGRLVVVVVPDADLNGAGGAPSLHLPHEMTCRNPPLGSARREALPADVEPAGAPVCGEPVLTLFGGEGPCVLSPEHQEPCRLE